MLLRNIDFFSIHSDSGICFEPHKDISELVPKAATRAWIHFIRFSAKIELLSNCLIWVQNKSFTWFENWDWYQIRFTWAWKKFSILKTFHSAAISFFVENQQHWIHALVAVFGTNSEKSFDCSKHLFSCCFLTQLWSRFSEVLLT